MDGTPLKLPVKNRANPRFKFLNSTTFGKRTAIRMLFFTEVLETQPMRLSMLPTGPINRFDISPSSIGFDLNKRLLRPGLVESTCRAHMRSEQPMAIVGL